MSGLGYSYLYRPTPVLTLGRLGTPPDPTFRGYVAGIALGAGHPSNQPGRSRGIAGDPWLNRSGVMRTFMGLGDDGDFSGPLDFGGTDLSDDQMGVVSTAYYSGALSDGGLNQILSGNVNPNQLGDFLATDPGQPDVSLTSPGTVAAIPTLKPGAGPTGTGIPPTASISSLSSAIANLFKPANPYAALPGYGAPAVRPGYSTPVATPTAAQWLSASTILAGYPNSTVLFGGLAVLALIGALGGRK